MRKLAAGAAGLALSSLLAAVGAAVDEPHGHGCQTEGGSNRAVPRDHPRERVPALEGEPLHELPRMLAGVWSRARGHRAEQHGELPERHERPDRPGAEPVV